MAKPKNIEGKKFGRLTALKIVGRDRAGSCTWLCKCECGNEKVISARSLSNKSAKSCGCLASEKRRENMIKINGFYHGYSSEKLRAVWFLLVRRCSEPTCKDFKYYGARGIKVCYEWLNDFQAFYDWAMSNGYKEGLTIDRIDANGNYEPSNCRWATMKEQSNNKRNNVLITFKGETHTLKQWSEIIGVNYYTMHKRYKAGKSPAEILKI